MPKIVDGLFLPIGADDIATVYNRLEVEGYERSPSGLVEFLRDVGAGRLDDEKAPVQARPEDILRAAGEHIAPLALDLLKRWRG